MERGPLDPWPGEAPDMGALAGRQEAAEEVRAHLVAVRGGALFLSSADALLLVRWLDDGVPVGDILAAIERAAEARRKARSRLPLGLGRVAPHLGKRGRAVKPRVPSARHPFDGLAVELRGLAATDGGGEALVALGAALVGVDPAHPDGLLRVAAALVRDFLDARWESLDEEAREALRVGGRAAYALFDDLDDHERTQLIEEVARDTLRSCYPMLTIASLEARIPG